MKEIENNSRSVEGEEAKVMEDADIDRACDMLAKIARNERNGYFLVIALVKLDEETTQADGIAKVQNCNKGMVIETSLQALGVTKEELMVYMLRKNMGVTTTIKMDFLVQLDEQLKDPIYRELTGINHALEVFPEYAAVMDADQRMVGTAMPARSPKQQMAYGNNWRPIRISLLLSANAERGRHYWQAPPVHWGKTILNG